MKLFFGLFVAVSSYAAIATGVVWEVRHAGANTNGGGFITGASGTDFSQQNAAQYTFTDLASTSGTTNPCIVTSASHNFVAADVGNIIHITAGTNWTASFYQIVSTATNAATLDRACGSSASISGGTYAVGGALGTIEEIDVAFAVTQAINQIAYVKADATYTTAGVLSTHGATGGNNFAQIIGYTTTRTDGGQFTLQASATSIFTWQVSGTALTVKNVIVDCNSKTGTAGVQMQNGMTMFVNLLALNCPAGGIATAGGVPNACINCVAKGTTGNVGINLQGTGVCWFCRATGGTVTGINNTTVQCYFCISDNNSGATVDGFAVTGYNGNINSYCFGCIAYNNGRDGFRFGQIVQPNGQTFLVNSIAVNNAGNGISNTSSAIAPGALFMDYNAVFGNGTNYNNITPGPHDVCPSGCAVAITGDPFVNGASNNFALNNTAGRGAVLRGAGFPGIMQSGGTGFASIGTLAPQGGGGAVGFPIIQ